MADTANSGAKVGTAGRLYMDLVDDRAPFLDRAIDSSRLTIPTLIPPVGHTASTKYYTPFQSVGAWGTNNLASRLMLALFPPNSPCFKLALSQFTLEKLGADPVVKADVDSKLNKVERAVQDKIEAEALRVSLFESLKHLLVAGNVLIYKPKTIGLRVFRLHNFVIQRDPTGAVLDIVTKESVALATLAEALRTLILGEEEVPDTKESRRRTVDLYTHVSWDEDGQKWTVRQEVEGHEVPDSTGTYAKDKSPWIPLRMTKIDGESYGRGYVEEYIGDLTSLEGLAQAVVEGSAAAAKLLFLVNPNGTTDKEDLAKTETGGFADGTLDDVGVLQLNKFNDFRVAADTINKIEERLSRAFMLNSAIQRSGERVTAEEIRFMAQELESSLGGIYSILAQELQLPLITRLMFEMQRAGELPSLPKGVVKPVIVTGLEALGRGNDLNKLDTFIGGILQVEEARSEVRWPNYLTRRATALGIDTEGLIRTTEEKAAEEEEARQQAMLAQGIGPAVNAAGGLMKQGMANAPQANPQG